MRVRLPWWRWKSARACSPTTARMKRAPSKAFPKSCSVPMRASYTRNSACSAASSTVTATSACVTPPWSGKRNSRPRRCAGLIGTRTQLLPHQIAIADQTAKRPHPRVLLADEAGLGKTIEAGLILHRQVLTGQAERILIVVPDALLTQWFVEMRRRFNLYFALFDQERLETEEQDNPFETEQFVLCPRHC